MQMRTIKTDSIVRITQRRKRKGVTEDLPSFDEAAWCRLCEFSYKHTLLVDTIVSQIKQHHKLINWIRSSQELQRQDDTTQETEAKQGQNGLPEGLVKALCDALASTPQFSKMSGRFYTSAIDRVEELFKGWFAAHQKLIHKIRGKRRWLAVVESDAALAETSNFSQQEIEIRAAQILAELEAHNGTNAGSNDHVDFNTLFQKFDETEETLARRAIIHLLKNGGKTHAEVKKPRKRKRKGKSISTQPLTLTERLEAQRVGIERLEKQLLGQLPRARNLFPEQAFEHHLEAVIAMPNSDATELERYYFLYFSLLLYLADANEYLQLERHLLTTLVLQWSKLGDLHYYRVLIYAFMLHAASAQQYLQLGSYLLQTIKLEAERVEAAFFAWHESITPKLHDFLREPKALPYPISFGYDDVRSWQMNQKGKIFFKLNGWGDLLFEVRCHHRQLPLIKTFLKDWQTKNASERKAQSSKKDPFTGSLMLLRSIELIWKPKEASDQKDAQLCSHCEVFQQSSEQGFWNECKLTIHWTFNAEALTRQGSEKMRQRKLELQLQQLQAKQAKLEQQQDRLDKLEQAAPEAAKSQEQLKRIRNLKKQIQQLQEDLAKLRPKLACLQAAQPFGRPDRPLYEGVPNIFVGVLLDLDTHLAVTVVDAMRRKRLALRSAPKISSEGYRLLQKYFRQRQEHSKQRQEDQQAQRYSHQTESGLGQQVDRLFAKGLVELAQAYKASTIVIPIKGGWRERLYSQLVARAKLKCNGNKQAMARYTKAHGERLHQWDYNRLSQAITDCAATHGIEVVLQKTVFETDVFQQAANLAIAAYDSLNSAQT
ncbi:type V CRISPR-associated protein Cas12k [Stenomitos frigidus]|uniref:Uncharacterized protein n=1 Tax=Stenomitos frigidus ULC18 TaxID=2107698 RepID=A0A2T1ELX3_9CYAN|nr:type V CRISPR-associated protein Cas12k [Stenomitos frigidus]PSB33726.1 hypothetical protein C7B82_04390 [Stenomitos frigidus ULC18]